MSLNTTLARPYAKAAFSDALQHTSITAWSNLLNLAGSVVHDARVTQLLKNPQIQLEKKTNWLLDVCAKVMHKAGENFFKLLAENRRLILLPEIAVLFEALRIEHEKTVNVKVTSAQPLANTEQQNLQQTLKTRLQRNIVIEYQHNADLLGGLVIQAGDLVIDDSVRSKLARLGSDLAS